ncbi:hypothetical protein EcB171_5638, partial [Escherichia coli B171]
MSFASNTSALLFSLSVFSTGCSSRTPDQALHI